MVIMAHGLNSVLKRGPNSIGSKSETKTGIGSRRIFPPHFKLQVLDSYRNDADCKGNQRATARKYGIHRRQIQKWLQAESNLRNSVGVAKGNKSAECEARKCGIELALRNAGHRQRDDLAPDAYSQCPGGIDARVPALSPAAYSENGWPDSCSPPQPPVPLDFTTHSRTDPTPLSDLSAPIDLSLKRPISVAPGDPCAPVYIPPRPHQNTTSPPSSSLRLPTPPIQTPPLIQPPPSLCLAQPVLSTSPLIQQADPDIWDLSTKSLKRKQDEQPMHSPASTVSSSTPKPVKLFKPYLDDLHDNSNSSDDSQTKCVDIKPCCDGISYHSTVETHYFNNNNNIYEFKSEYTYSLHELQPKTSLTYYYPIGKSYIYGPPEEQNHFIYDESILQPNPLKQRQSYSLDFKLKAIECYYQDEMCRGNQRAVASKYNIHRRQVQKWLKQEEELRQRNESVKLMHAVR